MTSLAWASLSGRPIGPIPVTESPGSGALSNLPPVANVCRKTHFDLNSSPTFRSPSPLPRFLWRRIKPKRWGADIPLPSSESSVANFRRQTRWRDATGTTWELKLKLHLDKLINQMLRLKFTEKWKLKLSRYANKPKQVQTGPDESCTRMVPTIPQIRSLVKLCLLLRWSARLFIQNLRKISKCQYRSQNSNFQKI